MGASCWERSRSAVVRVGDEIITFWREHIFENRQIDRADGRHGHRTEFEGRGGRDRDQVPRSTVCARGPDRGSKTEGPRWSLG